MKTIKTIKSISSRLLAEEVLRRGIKVKHLNPYQDDEAFLELEYKKHREFIVGQRTSKTSLEAYWIAENKELTKEFLRRNNINVATGKVFKKDDSDEVVAYCEKIKFPVVIKPVDGAHGKNIYTNLINKKEAKVALNKILKKNNYILVEKMFIGTEYRIIATRDKFLAMTYRDPANIIGDGVHSARELIKIKNNDSRRGDSSLDIFVKIKIDNIAKDKLVNAKIKLTDILPLGRKLYLRDNSNISTGGDSIDVTEQVHPEIKKIAVKIICAFPKLFYGGIDLMSNQDISKKPTKKSYIVLEVNSSPGISLQHYPYRGTSINIAKELVDMLFPETKSR